jgi:hypothetical protein
MSVKELKKNEMLEFLIMANKKCRNCGKERIEICEHNLPPFIKKHFDELV